MMLRRIDADADLEFPFGKLDGLDRDAYRETAYEIFFTSCRSSPGFGGRNALAYYNSSDGGDGSLSWGSGSTPSSPRKSQGVGMAVTSRVKRALGLKMIKRPCSRRTNSVGSISMPSSPGGGNNCPRPFSALSSSPSRGYNSPRASSASSSPRARRPLTSAEIMRQQMRVTEQSDNRLRKTLMRTLVGQIGRRAETIILPLELLRHLKPSEFQDSLEYHVWQKRQLKILEAGLLVNPSIPLDKTNTYAKAFREIVQSSEAKAIDTGKNSETMRSLCNSVVYLSWRSHDGSQTDVCHWADGYPLNVHIYMVLLASIFDQKEETLVLDEVDELLELMKKTWNILGINRSIHNLCLTWVLFEHYVRTGQVEQDLLGASLIMLNEVAIDAKKVDREPIYVQMLATVLLPMKKWAEKSFLDYHRNFHKGTIGLMERFLLLIFSANRILEDDVRGYGLDAKQEKELRNELGDNKVDHFIRTSLKNAFAKLLEDAGVNNKNIQWHEAGDILNKIAEATEDLSSKEKEIFSPQLKKWHPIAGGVAAVTLHSCYGTLLKQYLTGSSISNNTILVLQRAGRLEKALVQMIVEDSEECEDGGKAIVREMAPYEVDPLTKTLLRDWIQGRLKKGKETVNRAKETETWNPKSKLKPYAQSASELVHNAKESIASFFEMPIERSEDFVHDLTHGLEHLFEEYITFIVTCGSKQNYLPTLPPLTRCSHSSKFTKIWKRAACSVGTEDPSRPIVDDGKRSHPSTSRGTQRLYIRINTLYYLISQLHSIDKMIAFSPRASPSHHTRHRQLSTSSYFDHARQTIQVSSQHVAEVAAYRLIFLDSIQAFYGSLYVCGVLNESMAPVLHITKQNLTLLCAIVTDKAQPVALKEVMKASFEAYLMVLLAGGSYRFFARTDHEMIEEDFKNLKRLFCTCGEGLIAEDFVDREAEIVEGVIALMGQSTEQLVEDFSILVGEPSCARDVVGAGRKLPIPPTTGRWNRSDPNTILRVLCYRNDSVANCFLKRTFHLAKRRV
ncbi:hypothetical protein LIER_04290 [Lithospermum erythrorhizon]|uniref:Uncharacterized protein n=1 Tax=Lithospermum erythrorhizon TaxID=34254 RepID=A0AAV3NW90_LITER